MTGSAAHRPKFDHALPSDYPPSERNGPIPSHRHPHFTEEAGIPQILRGKEESVKSCWSIEYNLARRDQLLLCMKDRGIK